MQELNNVQIEAVQGGCPICLLPPAVKAGLSGISFIGGVLGLIVFANEF